MIFRGRARVNLVLAAALVAGLSALPAAAVAEPVGTQQQLTTFSPSATNTYCSGPSVAYNATSKKTMVTYIENVAVSGSAPDGAMVRTAFMNGDAALSSTPVDISTTLPSEAYSGCEPASVAAGPDGTWLVVWPRDDGGNAARIYAQVVDATGAPTGANFTLSSNTNYNDIETVVAAWSPTDQRYLVTWKAQVSNPFPSAAASQQVVGRFIDAAGAGIGNDFLVTNTANGVNNSQDLAYGNGRWISVVATDNNRRAVGQVVTTAGPQGSVFDLSTAGYNVANNNIGPSIAYNDSTGQFGVVWKLRNSPFTEYARLLDGSGVPLGSDIDLGAPDTSPSPGGPGGSRPRITSMGSYGYLATWHNPGGSNLGTIYAVRVLADGTVDGTPAAVSDAAPFNSWRPSVAYDASLGKALIAYSGQPSSTAPNNLVNYYARPWFVNNPAVELTVARDGTGSGTVTSNPAGIDCGSTCAFSFDSGAPVTITAAAASGSTFAGWGGACSGTATTCTVTMDAAKAVTATFNSSPTPSNSFTVRSTRAARSTITTRVNVPGAGRITQRATRSTRSGASARALVCTTSRTASRAATYTLTCKANSATRKAQRRGAVRVLVRTTFTPTGGTARTISRTVVLPSLKPKYTG